MQIEKRPNYQIPEGNYSATIVDAKMQDASRSGEMQECVRLVFEIDAEHPIFIQMAGKTYWQSNSEELACDFHRILGDRLEQVIRNRKVVAENLSVLVGTKVAFEVKHVHTNKHPKPYCNVGPLRTAEAA